MTNILEKLNSELAVVVAHKGYNVFLSILMKDGTKHNFDLGTGSWDVAPTEENGILTLRNNKEFAESKSSQTATTLTTTYSFMRINLEVAEIQEFNYHYDRDVTSTITPTNEE